MDSISTALDRHSSQLAREYEGLERLFSAQPAMTRHFLDSQAGSVLAGLEGSGTRIRFLLPDQIRLEGGETVTIPASSRARHVGGLIARMARAKRLSLLIRSLNDLEAGLNPALSVCGQLMRYALAHHLVYSRLPDGRPVQYRPESGEDIPSIPIGEAAPAGLLAGSDAVVEEDEPGPVQDRLQVPYVDAARRFYLPQWVAIGDEDRLLVGSLAEAEATLASLRGAVRLLEQAIAICPSLVADATYQRKRAGLLGQVVNQGRALARVHTHEIVSRIRSRSSAGSLNRGLSLSLPYFDDDSLSLQSYPVEVIPDGRILFVPAFVVRAMRLSQAKVRQDPHLGPTTRRHLLVQLASIESAFNGHSSH